MGPPHIALLLFLNDNLNRREQAKSFVLTLPRYIDGYEEDGLDGLLDERLTQASHRLTLVDEVL